MREKKRRRSGLRRGFLTRTIGKAGKRFGGVICETVYQLDSAALRLLLAYGVRTLRLRPAMLKLDSAALRLLLAYGVRRIVI